MPLWEGIISVEGKLCRQVRAMQTASLVGIGVPLMEQECEPQEATVTVGQKEVIRVCNMCRVFLCNLFEIHLKWQTEQRM